MTSKVLGYCLIGLLVIFYKQVPYSQPYLFNANLDTNHNANPTKPNGNNKW